MSDEEAFLRAICEQPDDDTPRLVFADWLDEQGGEVNAAWAKGIRDQIQLGPAGVEVGFPAPPDPIEPSHGRKKLKQRLGIPGECSVDDWERGFPTRLGGDFTTFAPEWPRLAFLAPWRTLYLSWTDDSSAASFVMWPRIDRFKALNFIQGTHTEKTLQILAATPALRGLESLTVGTVHLTDCGTQALLDSPHLAKLSKLRLYPYGLYRHGDCPDLSPPVLERLRARFGMDVFG